MAKMDGDPDGLDIRPGDMIYPIRAQAIAQPIESAPLDGTHIIGLCQWGWREMWVSRGGEGDGRYWTDAADSEPTPTHWIALPIVNHFVDLPRTENDLKQCDCCGEMKSDVRLIYAPHVGDTMACEECRHVDRWRQRT